MVDIPGNDKLSSKYYFYNIGSSVITDDVDSKYTRINRGSGLSANAREFDDNEGFEKIHYEEYAVDTFAWPEKTEELVSKFSMSVLNVASNKEVVIKIK